MKRVFQNLLKALAIWVAVSSCSVLRHQNSGTSKATGTVGNGSLENAWLLPYKGDNFKYFSPLSYYVLRDAFVHSKLHKTLEQALSKCESTCPGYKFRLMECANKHGGKMLIHRTHQSGLSIDLMTPMKKKGKQYRLSDRLGMWHYLLQYDDQGHWTKQVEVDFEALGKLILALDDASKNNGLRVSKVILKIALKDEFYASKAGQEVKSRGIYLAMALPKVVDNLHDDHIHVDFEEI